MGEGRMGNFVTEGSKDGVLGPSLFGMWPS